MFLEKLFVFRILSGTHFIFLLGTSSFEADARRAFVTRLSANIRSDETHLIGYARADGTDGTQREATKLNERD